MKRRIFSAANSALRDAIRPRMTERRCAAVCEALEKRRLFGLEPNFDVVLVQNAVMHGPYDQHPQVGIFRIDDNVPAYLWVGTVTFTLNGSATSSDYSATPTGSVFFPQLSLTPWSAYVYVTPEYNWHHPETKHLALGLTGPQSPYPAEGGAVMSIIDAGAALNQGDHTGGGDPVDLNNGSLDMSVTDLSSDGFGFPWGQTRTWTNDPGYDSNNIDGNGWRVTQLPTLTAPFGTNLGDPLSVIIGGSSAEWFDATSSAPLTYSPRYWSLNSLVHVASTDDYVYTDSQGDQYTFNGFGDSLPLYQKGAFISYRDAGGNTISVQSYNANGTIAAVSRQAGNEIETYLYGYAVAGSDHAGELMGVLLVRAPSSNPNDATLVRGVLYNYYDAGDAFGNQNDLEKATVYEPNPNTASGQPASIDLGTKYYRYYTSDGNGGYQGGVIV